MKNILVIAPTYCRSNCANGQIERHFFSNLPKNEYKVTILCSDRWDFVRESDNCVVKRTHFSKWIDYACRALFHTPFAYIGNTPDKEYYNWGKRAISEAVKLASKEKIDYIHSICMPCSSHIVAFEIKKHLNIPWVAQFYDPWSGNPYRVLKSKRIQQIDKRMEEIVAKNANLIIHPCDAMIDYWVNLYGENIKEKLAVLPFVTEISDIVTHANNSNKITISHIGSFSNNRNASVFIKALAKVDETRRRNIIVNFVGNVVEEDVKLINSYHLQDTIHLIGIVSESECYKYYEESDLFLIVDIDCTPNLFYPSKILKYFCYKKTILGITTEQSVVRDELTRTGNYAFSYNDVEGISEFLTKAVVDYPSICTNNKEYGCLFSKENVIKKYSELISRLL